MHLASEHVSFHALCSLEKESLEKKSLEKVGAEVRLELSESLQGAAVCKYLYIFFQVIIC